jgi:hypothetical protein
MSAPGLLANLEDGALLFAPFALGQEAHFAAGCHAHRQRPVAALLCIATNRTHLRQNPYGSIDDQGDAMHLDIHAVQIAGAIGVWMLCLAVTYVALRSS